MFEFFGFNNSKRKSNNFDDVFIDTVKSYTDIWTDIFSKDLSCILACPASNTLGDDTLTREQVMAHILLPDKKEGFYVNLCNQRLQLIGNELICLDSIQEPNKVKITSVESISNNKGQLSTIFRINRPIIGGIQSPEEPEEVSIKVMHKYVAMLRSFPEAETIFHSLDKYISEVNFVGEQSIDGFSKIKPSLQTSLQMQWSKSTERLYRCGALSTGLGNDRENSKYIIGQIVESYLMSGTYSTIYPWIIKQLSKENNKILVCMANLQSLTQTDLGIRPEFQCPNSDSVKILKTLSEATTPLDKLLILKRTINNISECINRNTTTKYCNNSLELATDDIVLIVIWIILKTSRSYENIYYDLYYAMDYHFLNTSKNELGFSLCHFQVAMSWLSSRAIDTPIYTKNKSDYYDFSTSPTIITTLNKIANHTNGSSNSNEVSDDRIGSSIDNINNSMNSTTSSPVTTSLNLQLSLPIDTITKDESSPLLPVGICIEAGNYNARYINEINALDYDLLIDYDISLSPRKSRPTSARTTSGKDLSNLSLSLNKSNKKITRSGNQIIIYKHFNNQDYEYNNLKIQSEETNKILDITNCQSNSNSYSVITVDGGLYAWGQPYSGRLGQSVSYELDSFDFILSPERICIGNDIKFKQVSCGRQHMLAVTEQGEVYAWGDNRCAQLGISTTKAFNNVTLTPNDLSVVMASSPTIVELLKSEKVEMVACGSYHSLCLSTSGVVYSWGRAANGRLGQFPCRLSIPEHAVGRPAIVRGPWVNSNDKNNGNISPRVNIKPYISNGINTSNTSPLIITKETYSNNNSIKTTPNRNNIPKLIPNQSFRLELSDKLYVSKSFSKLTKSDSFDSISTGLSNSSILIASIAAGFSHSIAISSNGKVFSWGCGTHGRLGHGSHCDEYLPKQIAALNKPNINIVSASAGLGHSMFLTKEGLLFGCGLNDRDQVGISISDNVVTGNYSSEKHSVLVPQPISIKPDSISDVSLDNDRFIPKYIESISCGDYHNAALTIDGKVYIWGNTTKLLNKDNDINKDKNEDLFRLLSLSSDCVPKQVSAAGDSTMIIV